MVKTVKARIHHGAESLDLTIPTDIVRHNDISDGDLFEVKVKEGEDITIQYKRVYKSEG